jgi:hypothetical protein
MEYPRWLENERSRKIVTKIKHVEVMQGSSAKIAAADQGRGVRAAIGPRRRPNRQTFDCWRKLYGGMRRFPSARLKPPQKENRRLRWAVSDLTSNKLILTGSSEGN